MTHVSTYVTIHPFTNIHNVPLPKEVTHSLSKLNLPNTTVANPAKGCQSVYAPFSSKHMVSLHHQSAVTTPKEGNANKCLILGVALVMYCMYVCMYVYTPQSLTVTYTSATLSLSCWDNF